jgi:hypothetical protein
MAKPWKFIKPEHALIRSMVWKENSRSSLALGWDAGKTRAAARSAPRSGREERRPG